MKSYIDKNTNTVEPAFKGHPRDQAKVSLHDRCPLVRDGEVLRLRITHQLNQNHSLHHITHKKTQLQLNHMFIAASLSDKKIADRHLLSSTSLPNRTVLHHDLEFGGNVDHVNVTRTSDKRRYVPYLGNRLLRPHDDHLLRWLLLLLALRIFGVHTLGTGDQRCLPFVTCDVSSAGGVIHGNILRPWHVAQQPGVGSTIWLRDFDGVRSDFLSRVSPSSRERRWRGLEARVIHLTDMGRVVSRDLDVKYMAVVTKKIGVCSRCPL